MQIWEKLNTVVHYCGDLVATCRRCKMTFGDMLTSSDVDEASGSRIEMRFSDFDEASENPDETSSFSDSDKASGSPDAKVCPHRELARELAAAAMYSQPATSKTMDFDFPPPLTVPMAKNMGSQRLCLRPLDKPLEVDLMVERFEVAAASSLADFAF